MPRTEIINRLYLESKKDLQEMRNKLSKEIGRLKARGEDADDLISMVNSIKKIQAMVEENDLPDIPFHYEDGKNYVKTDEGLREITEPKRRKDLKFQTVSPEWQESVEERLERTEDWIDELQNRIEKLELGLDITNGYSVNSFDGSVTVGGKVFDPQRGGGYKRREKK